MITKLYREIPSKKPSTRANAKKHYYGRYITEVPNRVTSSSSVSAICNHFTVPLDYSFGKIIKRNFKFFDKHSQFASILSTVSKDYELANNVRLKNVSDVADVVIKSTEKNLPKVLFYLLLFGKISTDTLYSLINGASVKEVMKDSLYNHLTKGQFKRLVNTRETTLQGIILDTFFGDLSNWRSLKSTNIFTDINAYEDYSLHLLLIRKLLEAKVNFGKIGEVNDMILYHDDCFLKTLYKMGVKRILEETSLWHDQMVLAKDNKKLSWAAKGYSKHGFKKLESEEDKSETTYHFVELTTSKALAEEGRVMRHCVYTYVDKCYNGRSCIISIQTTNSIQEGIKRHGTIEIVNGCVVQFRGKANSTPSNFINKIATAYFKSKDIQYARS